MLFSDLSGYTALNERLDPEQVSRLMERIKRDGEAIVSHHGGVINQFVGDEIVGLFGIPTTREDDPVRAVRAALELHALVRHMSSELEQRHGIVLRLHTGISTGLVVTSTADRRDGMYGLTGDTVNTGARLASHAATDTILVSPATWRLVAGYFEAEALPKVSLKGKADPVAPFRIIVATSAQSRFDVMAARGMTAYAGRSEEMAMVLQCLENAAEGRGQFVTVAGEAGLGKSRLMHEFRQEVDPKRFNILVGRCQPDDSATPYTPFLDMLRRTFGVDPHTTPVADLDKMAVARIRAVSSELEEFLAVFLHLLAIPSEEHPLPQRLQGLELRAVIDSALAALLVQAASNRPFVLILEDWHWADSASVGVLNHLVSATASHPVLLIALYRPESEIPWGKHPHRKQIALKALGVDSTATLAKAVWGAHTLPPDVGRLIHERTNGNPLFIEEMCRALVEQGSVRVREGNAELAAPIESSTLPSTVKAVIAARIDRLAPEARDLLRLASVIGFTFEQRLLEQIAEQPDVSEVLSTLWDAGLLAPVELGSHPVLKFHHALTQDVAYETLLLEQRRVLHGKVAHAMEALYRERAEDQAAALARHFGLAEDWAPAARYGRQAADRATGLGQFQAAANLYGQSESWLMRMPEDRARQEMILNVATPRISCLISMAQWNAAIEACRKAEPIAAGLGDVQQIGLLLALYGNAYFYQDLAKAEPYFSRASQGFEASGDAVLIARGHSLLSAFAIATGDWVRAADLAVSASNTYEREQVVHKYWTGYYLMPAEITYVFAGLSLAHVGRNGLAAEYLRKAADPELYSLCNLQSRTGAMQWRGVHAALTGEDVDGAAMLQCKELLQVAEKSDSPFALLVASLALSNIQLGLEQFKASGETCRRTLAAIEGRGLRTQQVLNLYYNAAVTELYSGAVAAARTHYDLGLSLIDMFPRFWRPRYALLEGLLLKHSHPADPSAALSAFDRSIALDLANGSVVSAAQTRYHRAQFTAQRGEHAKAESDLSELKRQFADWGVKAWAEKCAHPLTE